jgi:hypothetical protein
MTRRPTIRDGSAFATASDFLPRSQPGDEVRASGECVCAHCGLAYWQHALDPYESAPGRDLLLNVLCDGTRVKL